MWHPYVVAVHQHFADMGVGEESAGELGDSRTPPTQ